MGSKTSDVYPPVPLNEAAYFLCECPFWDTRGVCCKKHNGGMLSIGYMPNSLETLYVFTPENPDHAKIHKLKQPNDNLPIDSNQEIVPEPGTKPEG